MSPREALVNVTHALEDVMEEVGELRARVGAAIAVLQGDAEFGHLVPALQALESGSLAHAKALLEEMPPELYGLLSVAGEMEETE